MPQKNKPNHEIKAPTSPEEAWRMLESLSIYFSSLPVLAKFKPRLLCDYLTKRDRKGEQSLRSALVPSKLGRRPILADTDYAITKLLLSGNRIPGIVKALGVTKKRVELVRADCKAMFQDMRIGEFDTKLLCELSETPDDKLSEPRRDMLKTIIRKFAARQGTVKTDRRKAIIEAVVDAKFTAEDILDTLPPNPSHAFTLEKVDPNHKPILGKFKAFPV